MSKKSPHTIDPAIEAYERYRRANRAFDVAYNRLDAAEDQYWKPPHKMESPSWVFPDDKDDGERQEYTAKYESARKAAGLAKFDAARSATWDEYWAAIASLARTKATTPAGCLAKMRWIAHSIPRGTTDYDGAMVRSLERDLKRHFEKAA